MPVTVQCSNCSKSYTPQSNVAGKRLRCGHCRGIVVVPAADVATKQAVAKAPAREISSQASPNRGRAASACEDNRIPRERRRKAGGRSKGNGRRSSGARTKTIPGEPKAFAKWLAKAFSGDRIESASVSWAYRCAVLMVSVVMIALPLVYLGLIGLLSVGVWYAIQAIQSSAGSVAGTIINIIVVLSGVLTVLFMLKPLLGKPPYSEGRRTLSRYDEPRLFAFVEHICDIVGAPYPAQIDIDCTINAAASFNRGLLSVAGGDLRLNIGLALVAGLNVRQFAGVLAHEFGHFSQGTGMRVSLLIRGMSHWLTRVVYERDAWDERLRVLSTDASLVFGWMLMLARFGIWCTRRILWLFMLAGHMVSGFLLRQMEFDADLYEARVAGHQLVPDTLRRIGVLHVAYETAIADLQRFHDEGRLADNLPRLIVTNVDDIPKQVLKALRKQEDETTTGLFDTHPCFSDRVENAEQDGSAGIVSCRSPAGELFDRFDMRCRGVTIDYYGEVFHGQLKKKLIRPLNELLEIRRVQRASLQALRRYFQGNLSWYRSISFTTGIWTSETPKEKAMLVGNRQEVLNLADRYRRAWKKYSKAEGELAEAKLARTLIEAGFEIHPGTFSIPLTTRGQIRQAIDTTGVRQGKSEPTLRAFEEAVSERMELTLRMARSSEYESLLAKKGFRLHELNSLLQIYQHIYDNVQQLVEIHDQQLILGKLMALASEGYRHDAVLEAIYHQMEFLNEKIASLHKLFLRIDYPFDHARAGITLAEYMLRNKRLPAYSDPIEVYTAADNIATSLPVVQVRVLGRLCEFSEAVESLAGLTPLDDLAEADDDDQD